MIDYKRHRKKIEKLYTDRCTISRYEDYKDPEKKETKLQLVQVYADQPCRISQRALGTNNQTEAQNEVLYETKLFTSSELVIKQGDAIEVTRGEVPRTYEAGEPFLYLTHQEVSLQRKDYA